MFKTKKEKLLLEHMCIMETIKYLVIYSISHRGSACVDGSRLIKGSEEARFNEVYERTIMNLVERNCEIFAHFDKEDDYNKIFNKHFYSFKIARDPDGIFSVYAPETKLYGAGTKEVKFDGDIISAVLEAADMKSNPKERRETENTRGFHIV